MPKEPINNDLDLVVPHDPQSITFVNDLIKRGEAVAPFSDGSLAPGVTHVIVGKTDGGHPVLRRVRFNTF